MLLWSPNIFELSQGYEIGWGTNVVLTIGGFFTLRYFYKFVSIWSLNSVYWKNNQSNSYSRKAIRPIVINKDAEVIIHFTHLSFNWEEWTNENHFGIEKYLNSFVFQQERPTIDDDDNKAAKISEFYLKRRLQRLLGIKKDKKKWEWEERGITVSSSHLIIIDPFENPRCSEEVENEEEWEGKGERERSRKGIKEESLRNSIHR